MILFLDTTWFTQMPPLRATWSPIGERAEVPVEGALKRVGLTGVLNIMTGRLWLYGSSEYNKDNFAEILENIRRIWRGWNIVLFADKMSSQKCPSSRELARSLRIEIRLLPTASSEKLNPLEKLWGYVKGEIAANEATPNVDKTVMHVADHLRSLPPREILQKSGVLADTFWLREFVPKRMFKTF